MKAVLRSGWMRAVIVLMGAVAVVALLWWRGPAWGAVGDAFTAVEWQWVAAAVGLNLLSVVVRAVAWRTVIVQAMPAPHPRFPLVFSAFSVGLFANAVLPGRIGELARVAVLQRKLPEQEGAWATLLGTVFAHRVFDLVAAIALIAFVVSTAHIPDWAITSLIVVVVAGVALFSIAVISARRHQLSDLGGLSSLRKILRLARHGLGVMREPTAAALACSFQVLGWACQLFAVWTAMRAFGVHKPLPAAGLVLVLMNVATIFPLWPGNVGLVQAAISIPLKQYYNVARATGVAFGFGLQAIEASVGVGVGLIFLAREGLSFAMLRVMPDASQAEIPEPMMHEEAAADAERHRARVPG
ncbi:MAG: flippase-like domain-containing protein [Actinobacteria bacterium]|nr:MAG: flippase-like domain-containing protein [Actinomycetota bacterium]